MMEILKTRKVGCFFK